MMASWKNRKLVLKMEYVLLLPAENSLAIRLRLIGRKLGFRDQHDDFKVDKQPILSPSRKFSNNSDSHKNRIHYGNRKLPLKRNETLS
jgi:hypothetical protein